MKKALLLPFILSIFFSTPCNIKAEAPYLSLQNTKISYSIDREIIPRKDNIQWRYKRQNGIGYKRLYNYTTSKWVGKWIKV